MPTESGALRRSSPESPTGARIVQAGGVPRPHKEREPVRWPRVLRILAAGAVAAALAATGVTSIAAPVWSDPLVFLPFYVTCATVGFVILVRRPANRIAWLLVGIGIVPLLGSAGAWYATWAIPDHPGAPLVDLGRWLATWCYVAGFGASTILLVLFPDGRLPAPRWRVWFAVTLAGLGAIMVRAALGRAAGGPAVRLGNPYELSTLEPLMNVLEVVGGAIVAMNLGAGLLALWVRFQRSTGVEKQQVMWLLYGVALSLALTAPLGVTYPIAPELALRIAWVVIPLAPLVGPVCIGVALLRYRLYDIDRVVSRTVTYASLTVLIALPYIVVVVAASRLAGDRGHVAVGLATLAAATVFNPVRRRVQDRVDRRFNRARYDAARTVEAFRARLRQEVDLEQVRDDLLAVVRDTVQPVTASVWLRRPGAGSLR
jgi:hypothetical protein